MKILISLVLALLTACSALPAKRPEVTLEPKAANLLEEEQAGIAEVQEDKAGWESEAGEKLVYKVQWLGLHVAEAIMESQRQEIDGREVWQIRLIARTNGLVEKLFPVHNTYGSYLDVKNSCSLKSETWRKEGRRMRKDEIFFDWPNCQALYRDLLKNRQWVIDIPDDTYDALAILYYFRKIDLEVGETIHCHVFSNGKVYPFYAKVVKKCYLTVPDSHKLETFVLEPYIIRDGRIDSRVKATVYLTADENKRPVCISLRGPVFFKINVFLTSYQSL